MMHRYRLLTILLLFVLGQVSYGQTKRYSDTYLLNKYGHVKVETPAWGHQHYFEKMGEEMGLSASSTMVLKDRFEGKNGYTHYKYRQYCAGLPIEGATYILHEKDGQVVKANGHYAPYATFESVAALDLETVHNVIALDLSPARVVQTSEPELCLVDPAYPERSGKLVLVYRVDVESADPFSKHRYYVDAGRGAVITRLPLILEEGVPSTAETRYYGTVAFVTDSVAPNAFYLRDPTRGEGITVADASSVIFTNGSRNWNLANEQKDEVALDAHYCTTKYYDLMLSAFGWQGQDGNGKALRVRVHNNLAGNVNAFWDGEYSNYGDGNCLFGPLTTLEVVGHEFTHGMIDYSSKLVYSGESGAVNECLADLFGKFLEYREDSDHFSWELGHSFILSPDAAPIRIMNDPKRKNMPALYKGEYWVDGGGVHTNSAIGNLWFTMLVDGKQGINEAGIPFDVTAIGMDKAIQIAFYANKNYLTESSNYTDFYLSTLDAAEELFGSGSPELTAVEAAWQAVGLPYTGSNLPDYDLSIQERQLFISYTCDINQYIPFSVDIENVGQTAYLPSDNAKLKCAAFDGSLADYIVDVDQAIEPGEVLTITVDDWFISAENEFKIINIDLELEDDNAANNFSQVLYNIAYPENDLSVFLNVEESTCFDDSLSVAIILNNDACATLPAGTPLTFKIENELGNILWSENYTLETNFTGFGWRTINRTMLLNPAPRSTDELTFRLEFADDVFQESNVSLFRSNILQPISGAYLNTFTDETFEDGHLLFDLNNIYVNTDPLVAHQGDSYFGVSGKTSNPEDFLRCPDYPEAFNHSSGVEANISACIDFSQSANPVLDFDLIQYRSDFSSLSNYPYSSMLQVEWTGNESGNTIIAGQPEGALVHHQLPLPSGFKGKLKLTFYTESGKFGAVDAASLDLYDVLLLDNYQLSPGLVGTEESDAPNTVQLMPNPVNDRLLILADLPVRTIELYDLQGKMLQQKRGLSPKWELSMGELANGVYILRMETTPGQWQVERLIKL